MQIDGADFRARAAHGRDRDQRRADTQRPSRATPHFAYPLSYGRCMEY